MANKSKLCILWLLVALWMLLIFLFSAQVATESSGLSGRICRVVAGIITPGFDELPEAEQAAIVDNLQTIVRKTAHVTEYAILGGLLMLALLQYDKPIKWQALIALTIAVLYAATDELHQLLVVGRSCEMRDVMIDGFGAIIGIGLIIGARAVREFLVAKR